ncbi:hypothetical protein ACLOJK_012391 [Asimina triloba]
MNKVGGGGFGVVYKLINRKGPNVIRVRRKKMRKKMKKKKEKEKKKIEWWSLAKCGSVEHW